MGMIVECISAGGRLQLDRVIVCGDCDLEVLLTKQKCAKGDGHCGYAFFHLQVNLGIGARKQLSLCIVDIHFDVQRPGSWVDRSRRAHEFALEGPTWKFCKLQVRRKPGGGRLRVDLWHADEDPQLVDGGGLKQGAGLSATRSRVVLLSSFK